MNEKNDCDRPELGALHHRLLTGDTTAAQEIAHALLPWLLHRLFKRLPHTDDQLVSNGGTAALLAYFRKPEMFDPSRGERLDLFLAAIARRNLGHLLRGEIRRKSAEEKAGEELSRYSVEVCPWPGNSLVEAEFDVQHQLEKLVKIVTDPRDRAFVELWKQGEWHTDAFAKLMGLAGQPMKVQASKVKQTKDRIIKMLQRELASWPKSERRDLAAA